MRRDLRCFFFIREDCLESLNVSEIPLQRQHFLLSYFKTLKVCPAGAGRQMLAIFSGVEF